MHVNPSATNKDLAWAKAKASEMRRAAQILLDRAAELDAMASNRGTDSGRNGVRPNPMVPARHCGREYGRELVQIDDGKLAAPLSNGRRQHRAKQRLDR